MSLAKKLEGCLFVDDYMILPVQDGARTLYAVYRPDATFLALVSGRMGAKCLAEVDLRVTTAVATPAKPRRRK